ncbi:ABC transporter permease [Bifidobacterium felsineum]|uniref:ABC transporter permease n=1 Tax=Bifidobacterium felsineum TaxID=2045440 RepID=UPI001BDDB769|nr:ABC transporter permease [Bifidobacterium felsineum]MBT1165064.1 ABC transporter permease [Bifidobacterium felsineum]
MSNPQDSKAHTSQSSIPEHGASARINGITSTIQALAQDRSMNLLVTVFIIVAAGLFIALPDFRTAANLNSMALQISDLGIMALAMTVSMIAAGIDLSVVAVANLSGIIGIRVMESMGGVESSPTVALIGVLVMLSAGTLLGLINGMLVGLLRIPPILATLATMTLWGGVGTAATNGVSISGASRSLTDLGNIAIFSIPVPTLVFILAVILVWLFLAHTPTGVKTYLYGSNAKASLFSGVNNATLMIKVYTFCGLLSSLAGVVILMRTLSASPTYGSSYVLLAILVAVLGGVSVTGGSGRVTGVVVSLITLQMLSTGFNMLLVGHGNSNFFKSFAWGLFLLLIVWLGYMQDHGFGFRLLHRAAQGTPRNPSPTPGTKAEQS